MVLPVAGYLLSLGAGALLRYATRQAALSAAKRYGGKVLTKAAAEGKKAVDAGSKAGLKIIKQNRKPGATTANKPAPKKPAPTKKAPAKKSPTLKTDPKDAPASVKARAAAKNKTKPSAGNAKKQPVTGDKVQRGMIVAATTIPMFMDTSPAKKDKRKPTGMSDRKSGASKDTVTKAQESLAAKSKAQGGGAVLSGMTKKKASPESAKSKSWKDYKTVGAAQKAGADYFMGRDGKKKIAVTQEQLKKSGKSLREYANKLRKKGK